MAKGPSRSTGLKTSNMSNQPNVGRSAGLSIGKRMSNQHAPNSPYTTGKNIATVQKSRTGEPQASARRGTLVPNQPKSVGGKGYKASGTN